MTIQDDHLWRSIRELTLADQLATLANREPLAGFAPWAELMSRNLSARDRASDTQCINCDKTAAPGCERCDACDYVAYCEREDQNALEAP